MSGTIKAGLLNPYLALPLILAVTYVIVCAAAFLLQERLLFPAWAVPRTGSLPPGAERLTIERGDGVTLHGIHIPAAGGAVAKTLILAFPGNATNAQALAQQLADIYPDRAVATFYYRGYAPSTGTAAAVDLIEDAPLVFDLVQARYRPARIVALGQSLGSGVAASLATRRPLAGLILITPYDSLRAVAAQNYPWLPVRLLFRHEMDSAAVLREAAVPVAILAAGRDSLIRPARTDALRAAASNIVFDVTLPAAAHNTINIQPGFAPAMRQAAVRIEQEQA